MSDSQGRYIAPGETLASAQIASAARTTTGAGSSFDTNGIDAIKGLLEVTASSGTPTLDVKLETTADGTNYYTVGTFTQKTGITAPDSKVFAPLGTLSRWAWTIAGGTPSVTFYITATTDRDN